MIAKVSKINGTSGNRRNDESQQGVNEPPTALSAKAGGQEVVLRGSKDAPQDMKAGREAGVAPIGVTTGVFTAEQLTSAGAEKVIPDLKDADDILQMLRSGLGVAF